MSATVRPLYLPGSSALRVLSSRARDALDAWAGKWVIGCAESRQCLETLQAASVGESDAEQSEEYECLSLPAGCLWIRSSCVDRLRFGRAIVGPHLMPHSACADDWIAGVVDHAWRARNRALCATLLAPSTTDAPPTHRAAPAASLFALGSGAVKLACEPIGLHVLAAATVWKSIPPTAQARTRLTRPVPVDHALRRASVRVEAVLGSVEVPVAKVVDLRTGDVLRLPQRLDQPITVQCHGLAFASAVLGVSDGRKAVQLAPQSDETRSGAVP